MKTHTHGLWLAAVAAIIATGCSSHEEDKSISLDQIAVSFPAVEAEPITVKVTGSTAWTATPSEEWIEVTPGEGEFTVTVTDNTATEERNGSVVVSAAGCKDAILTVNQLAGEASTAVYRFLEEFGGNKAALSPSGRFLACYITGIMDDDQFCHTPVLIDIEKDEEYRLETLPEPMYALTCTNAVSDTGTAYYEYSYNFTLQADIEGNIVKMEVPEGYTSLFIYGCSGDGSVLVGTAQKWMEFSSSYFPLKFTNGVMEVLPTTGLSYHDTESWGGVIARGCSIDGKIVYGTDWENFYGGMCYWDADEGNEFHWVGEECGHRYVRKEEIGWDDMYEGILVDGVQGWGGANYLSPNGKWIAGEYTAESASEDKTTFISTARPYFFDLENKQGYIIDGYGDPIDSPMNGYAVTDDGIGFISQKTLATSCIVVDARTGNNLGDLPTWVENEYGISIPDGFACYCAPNGVLYGRRPDFGGLSVTYPGFIVKPAGL